MRDWLTHAPNWVVQTCLGAILGLAIPHVVRATWWVLNVRRRHPLHGKWFCYYYSTAHAERVFKPEEWTVSRSLRHALAVKTKSTVQPVIEYRGHMTLENQHVLVDMDSISAHKERVHIRFLFPTAAVHGPIVGLGIQYDYDGSPEASVNILSRDPLSEQAFKDLARHRVTVPLDRVSMRCD